MATASAIYGLAGQTGRKRNPEAVQFAGFSSLKSNVTYTPNQFFDVVLRYASRPTVRIVAYMFRKTLGWCDEHGNPQEEQITISYGNLTRNANVSRRSIRRALDEAIEYGFLTCLREAKQDTVGCHRRARPVAMPIERRNRSVSALYEIRWDEANKYTTKPDEFRGFYARDDANRTYVPNEFFDVIVRNEPLSVIKVVGAIIRHTIGFSTKAGFRRQIVRKSFDQLMRLTRLSRRHLNNALVTALAKNYICRVETGYFDKNAGLTSRAAVYAISWAEKSQYDPNYHNTPLAAKKIANERTGVKRIPDGTSKKETGTGEKWTPEKRGKKDTGIEIKPENKTSVKQQQDVVAGGDFCNSYSLLISHGITEKKAIELAQKFPYLEVKNQCDWLQLRTVTRSRTGFLVKAIEDRLPRPEARTPQQRDVDLFVSHYYAARAGNADTPVAEPSHKEIQHACKFIGRLLTITGQGDSVQLGRRFGEFAAKADCQLGNSNKSFVFAIRNHGDAFCVLLKNHAARKHQKAIESAKATHQKQHLSDYHKYLDEKENEIKVRFPDVFARFLAAMEANRTRSLSLLTSDECIAQFDSKGSKRHRFSEYFRNHPNCPVADFWRWDREINGDSFNAKAQT